MSHSKQESQKASEAIAGFAHLGWVCRDASGSATGAIWNETRDVCLLLAGEAFLESERINALRERGHAFTAGTAEFVVHLYEEYGAEFLELLSGAFSGVLIDRRLPKPIVMLFNDRFGLERIYYHQSAEGFYFASEAKALLKVLPSLRRLNDSSLEDYLSFGCTIDNRSLFQGIQILPGGSFWRWESGGEVQPRNYWSVEKWNRAPVLGIEEYYTKLSETLIQVAPNYLYGASATAMSITGGVDSRMVIAALQPEPGTLDCYTFGGMYRESEDVKIGREVAHASSQNHYSLVLNSSFMAEFPALAEEVVYTTDGAMSVSGAGTLFLNRLARTIAPIRLTGNYGGEVLRGLISLRWKPTGSKAFAPELRREINATSEKLGLNGQLNRSSFIVTKQIPWFHYGMFALERAQLTVRTPFLDKDVVALCFQAPPEAATSKYLAFRFLAERAPHLASIPNDRGIVWNPRMNERQLLRRMRRLSSEILPRAEYLCDYGMPRWLAWVDRFLGPIRFDRWFLGNQKYSHFRTWYRRELSGYVRELLLDHQSLRRSYVEPREVERVVAEHTSGRANHTKTIHQLLTLELLHRTLLDV